MHLLDPFGQAGGARLQDVGGLDLEDAIVADGAGRVPARPRLNRRLPHFLAAPRREDHLRIAARDLRRIDDAIPGEAGVLELGEDRRPAGDRDELFHPSNAGDQRRVPLLEEHAWPRRKPRRRFPDALQPLRQLPGELLGFLLTADQPAEHRDHLQDLVDAALIEHDHVQAAADELGDEIRLQIREREHEVRFQRFDLVELRVDERRHFRLEPRLRRTHRVAGDADDTIALAEQVERLGRLLGQAHDPARVLDVHLNTSGWIARASLRVASTTRGPGTTNSSPVSAETRCARTAGTDASASQARSSVAMPAGCRRSPYNSSMITSGLPARSISVLACTACCFTPANTLRPPAISSMSCRKPYPPLAYTWRNDAGSRSNTSSVDGCGRTAVFARMSSSDRSISSATASARDADPIRAPSARIVVMMSASA